MRRGVVLQDTPEGVWIRPKEQKVILDTREAISLVRTECERYGEISAVDFNDETELDMFMADLVSQIEYYPAGYTNEQFYQMINKCLDNMQEYTRYPFTPMQRYLWAQVATSMVSQTFQFRLRDSTFISRFTYDRMLGDSVVLKLYE